MNKEYMKKLIDILGQVDDSEKTSTVHSDFAAKPAVFPENPPEKYNSEENCIQENNTIQENRNTGANHDTRRRYSREFKKMIVHLHKEERMTFDAITLKYGVPKPTVVRWCSDARYENIIKTKENEKELQNIRREYERVLEENKFLRSAVILILGQKMEVNK